MTERKKPCPACIENHRFLYIEIVELRDRLKALEAVVAEQSRDTELLAQELGFERALDDGPLENLQ